MRKLYFFISLLLIFTAYPTYAGCYAVNNLVWYWGAPDAKMDVSYTTNKLTSDMAEGTRIGTITLSFSCPSPAGGRFWQEDNYLGGSLGQVFIPLPEFNFTSADRMDHKSGWVYIKPDNNRFSLFGAAGGNSWWFPFIGFSSFNAVMGGNNGGKLGNRHTYGIYTSKLPANIASTSKLLSMLTSATGMQATYRSGGNSPTNNSFKPSTTNNAYTLNYTNTVTCSVSSNVGNNLDLGVVNIHGNLNTPLATIVLKMSCGLGIGGGNLTSNYPSFIIPHSSIIEISSPNVQSFRPGGNFGLHIGNGWAIKFDTNGRKILPIDSLSSISIPILPWKYWASPGNSADWRGAVNFTINYN